MWLRQLFDHETWTYTYLLADRSSGTAALIDPVLEQVERDLQLIRELDLTLKLALDTHVHADHITGAGALRDLTNCQTVGGTRGAGCTDLQVGHREQVQLGAITLEVLETPGHTDDSLSFHAGDHVFTGDTLFVRGTGRTDFQNGDPAALYDSITQLLFQLPDETIVWPGHDYRGHTQSTIGEEKRYNPRVVGRDREAFIELMRNLKLPRPKHIETAVPANRACGHATLRLGEAALHQEEPSPGPVRDVSAASLSQLPAGTRIVDVREDEEFHGELGHLPEAERVGLAELDQASRAWDRQAPLLLVCRSGRRSRQAAEWLTGQGFTEVMNLQGGMLAAKPVT